MNHYLILIIHAFLLCICNAKDFECAVSNVANGSLDVEVKNITDQDIVIMGGEKDSLVCFGILYFPDKDLNYSKIESAGRVLAMFERPNLMLLPINYSCKFRIKFDKISDKSKIAHMKIGFNYISYNKLSEALKKNDSFPTEIGWIYFKDDLVNDPEAIKMTKMKYEFAWGL